MKTFDCPDYIDTINNSHKLCKMDLDGKNKVTLNTDSVATTLYKYNDSLFYKAFNFNFGSKFYRLKLDGSGKSTVIDDSIAGFTQSSNGVNFTFQLLENIKDNWIYYINAADSNKLYKISIDGTGKTKLTDESIESFDYELVGNWIYYKNSNNSNKIYKIYNDGTQKNLVDTN